MRSRRESRAYEQRVDDYRETVASCWHATAFRMNDQYEPSVLFPVRRFRMIDQEQTLRPFSGVGISERRRLQYES